MSEIKTTGKMKIAGYSCLVVALLLTVIKILGFYEGMELIEHWSNIGLYLLFGNVVKHNIRNGIEVIGGKK